MDNSIVVNDYHQMDKILKEERQYLLNICKKIKKCGCNVLLIQKSILRDAVNDLSLHFLSKLKILAIKEIERDEVEFICKVYPPTPRYWPSLEHWMQTHCRHWNVHRRQIGFVFLISKRKLTWLYPSSAELVEEITSSGAKFVKVTGIKHASKTVSVIVRGANSLVLEEAERSLHDALCVIRCLVKNKYASSFNRFLTLPTPFRALIAGGGAPEISLSYRLSQFAKTVKGMEIHCIAAFAEALEVIPVTLAENAGLNSIAIVTELRNRHANGDSNAGINVRKVQQLESSLISPPPLTGNDYEYIGGERGSAATRIHQCDSVGYRDCSHDSQNWRYRARSLIVVQEIKTWRIIQYHFDCIEIYECILLQPLQMLIIPCWLKDLIQKSTFNSLESKQNVLWVE